MFVKTHVGENSMVRTMWRFALQMHIFWSTCHLMAACRRCKVDGLHWATVTCMRNSNFALGVQGLKVPSLLGFLASTNITWPEKVRPGPNTDWSNIFRWAIACSLHASMRSLGLDLFKLCFFFFVSPFDVKAASAPSLTLSLLGACVSDPRALCQRVAGC